MTEDQSEVAGLSLSVSLCENQANMDNPAGSRYGAFNFESPTWVLNNKS